MCTATTFWWWQPIPEPDQSSSTRSRRAGRLRSSSAANAFARNGPIATPGTEPENSAAVSRTRTSTPAPTSRASRSASGS
ncbi:hypothetical protein [Pseudonocardia sp. HH130630-07]|uniref:hypothetical protein n=1 Tax=Pseudonocardia sp. HH130630-07 TaxID=1690815 RepID=UPI000814DC80|nr:hypothetical protein [Pseudonocardia sp. HH130630-07]ANY07222.1 hypothetical protein AFB00_14070 [Pseudonocardia sp. HH130630-07]